MELQTTTTIKHPLDFKALEDGQVLSVEELERITGYPASDYKNYRLECLDLMYKIDRYFEDAGKPRNVVFQKDCIRILPPDGTSVFHCIRRCETTERQYKKAVRKLQTVPNPHLLNAEEKQTWERNAIAFSKRAAAIGDRRRIMIGG